MKIDWKKYINCVLVGLVVIIIIALAYSINLGLKQQEAFIRMDGSLDRIMHNVKVLEAERNKLEKENEELKNWKIKLQLK